MFPAASSTILPEIEAVGLPELTLIKANLADDLDCPPTKKSPLPSLTKFSFFAEGQVPNFGIVPPKRHCVDVPEVICATIPDALVYRIPPSDTNLDNVISPEALKVPITSSEVCGITVPIPTLALRVSNVTKGIPEELAIFSPLAESRSGCQFAPFAEIIFPRFSIVNLAVPLLDALIIGPVES